MTKVQNNKINQYISQKFKILDVIKSYGYEPRMETDDRFTMRCPFHNENTGSFKIYVDKNNFHCYGCTANGNVITFMMLQENKSYKEIIDKFKDNIDVVSNKFMVESIINNVQKEDFDVDRFKRDIHYELRKYLRDMLVKNPSKEDLVDDCFREMCIFFGNKENTTEETVRRFSDQMLDKVK